MLIVKMASLVLSSSDSKTIFEREVWYDTELPGAKTGREVEGSISCCGKLLAMHTHGCVLECYCIGMVLQGHWAGSYCICAEKEATCCAEDTRLAGRNLLRLGRRGQATSYGVHA